MTQTIQDLAADVEVTLDLETQGLRYGDNLWEAAALRRKKGQPDQMYVWHLIGFDSAKADRKALAMTGFYDRYPGAIIIDENDPLRPIDEADMMTHPAFHLSAPDGTPIPEHHHRFVTSKTLAFELERIVRGAVVWGCNPTYDVSRLEAFLAAQGIAWSAHYRPMCATTYAAGVASGLGLDVPPPPYKNEEIGAIFGVPRNPDGKAHQGIADCYYAAGLVDAARRRILEARR